MTQKAIDLIKHYESLHDGDLKVIGLQPKQCPTGYWTMGYGHVIIDPLTLKPLKGLSQKARAYELFPNLTFDQADFYLLKDTTIYEGEVRSTLKWQLNDDQVGALVSFAYNIGFPRFSKPCTALRLINEGDLDDGPEALLMWNKGDTNGDGVLEVLPGLTFRRKSEIHLFKTGELKFFN